MANNANKNIKAIVFDYGGVINVNEGVNTLKAIAEIIGVSADDFRVEYFKHNHLSNVENLPFEELMAKVASAFTNDQGIIDKAIAKSKEYYEVSKINTELIALFPILKKQGLKVAILSNSTSELRKRLNDNGVAELVDEVIISGEIGFQKPHQEAFQVLFDKLEVKPEEVIFVDDAPKSLEKASEIGYIPILFKNNEQLKADLKSFGVGGLQ